MESLIFVISNNDEISKKFIKFCKKNNLQNKYKVIIVNYDKENKFQLIFSTFDTVYNSSNDIYFDIYNQILLDNIPTITLIKLLDQNIYLSLIEESLILYNQRDIKYLIVNKDVVTKNSIEIIDSGVFFEKIFTKGSGELYKLDKNINSYNRVFKTLNDYKFALKNPAQVFNNPTKIYLQLLDNCSKKCPKCIYNPRDEYVTRRDGFEIPFELLEKVFKELATFKQIPFMEPSFDCEPLMYRRFDDFLQLATQYKIPLHIVTNAMLLSDEKIDLLLSCKEVVNVVISLDAITQETYRIVQPFGKLKKVEDNIHNFIKKRGKSKHPAINFCFTEGEKNQHEFQDFLEKWVDKVDSISRNNMFGEDDIKKFSSKNFKKPEYGYCFPMYTDIFISSRGEVFNCHQDVLINDPVTKNLSETTLLEAYNSKKLQNRRDCHAKKDFPELCINCLEFAVFEPSIEKNKDMLTQTFPFHKIYQKI